MQSTWLFCSIFSLISVRSNDFHSNFIAVTTFIVSAIVSHQHKLDMVHIQNSTLAGGVAIGAVCNFLVGPCCALLIGSISAVISVLGYRYLTVGFILFAQYFASPCEHNWQIDCYEIVFTICRQTLASYRICFLFFFFSPRSIHFENNLISLESHFQYICLSCSSGVWMKYF